MMALTFYLLIMLAAHAGLATAAPRPDATVAIRTFNYAALSVDRLADARSEAAHLFRRAGIRLEWIDCRVAAGVAGDACLEPLLAGRDLMLRLVDRTPVDGRIIALGESMLDREQRGGVLMTVDVFPVRTIAGQASTPVPTLLGRAIAHEIGHLLLGSAEHPRFGLMRALWSHDELRGVKPAHWGFSRREGAQMRETLRHLSRRAD